MIESVVIIGSGPAAHTAAIYAARAQHQPLLFEGEMAGGVAAGGQLTTTTEVENFPGFPKGIGGPELMIAMREQSEACGTRILTETVTHIDLSVTPFVVTTPYRTVSARTVIVSTGATAKRLGVTGEDRLWQKGISACAVCDGALPMFRQKPLVVVGGGDSACEEATFLMKYASHVTLVVRKNHLRASKVMQDRVLNHPNITVAWESEVIEANGDNRLESVTLSQGGKPTIIPASGLFYAIGHVPNTAFLNGQLDCDEMGYIRTVPGRTLTNVPGVFACGDVQDHRYRQAITAAGSGCMAALDADAYLTAG